MWKRRAKKFPQLDTDVIADVAIIGAGITGLTTAYMLSRDGFNVVVIDGGRIGGGDTGNTTAHITFVLDWRYHEIKKMHGEEKAKLAAESHISAINRIESIVRNEKIDCDFERLDGFFLAEQEELEKEEEMLRSIGAPGRIENSPIFSGKCLRFPDQAQFHPLKYLSGLTKILEQRDVRIFENTGAEKIQAGEVLTQKASIHASDIVVATYSPVKGAKVFMKQTPYRSYAIAAPLDGVFKKGLYWDNEDPYHYIRMHGDHLIIGGEDHKTGQGDEARAFAKLKKWAARKFPIKEADYEWSGQILEPADALAYIGKSPWQDFNLFLGTGYSGNGMTYGTLAGIIISDLISGNKNRWAELYALDRGLTPSALATIAKDQAKIMQEMVLGKITGGEKKTLDQIMPGEGGVINQIAVFKDVKGELHAHSAVCTHMGCTVKWNSPEKSFDCPCHGSRFSTAGKVMNGPAIKPLAKIDIVLEDQKPTKKQHRP